MTEPRSDDLLKSRQEAALLLRLDPQNLSPSDALRCDLIATLARKPTLSKVVRPISAD
jgi:hypothetical protein